MSHAIVAEGIGKKYRIGASLDPRRTLREAIVDFVGSVARRLRSPIASSTGAGEAPTTFWALRDVSFQVPKGEALGIIGHNGAGKSTLLKILSRITEPTVGEARVRGRVGSLLEVGTGFHSELTGRENVFLSGAVLGMKRAEILRKFEEIVEFAEVSAFIDTPVKHYSSGMYLRLAFSVAAHLEPDVLIIDEVLAVGDENFQHKCLGRMKTVTQTGRTVIFVSHNLSAVRTLCRQALVLDRGQVADRGTAVECVQRYASLAGGSVTEWQRPDHLPSTGALLLTSVESELGGHQPHLRLDLTLQFLSRAPHPPAFVAVDILDALGTPLMQALPRLDGFIGERQGIERVRMEIDLPPLIPDTYFLNVWAGSHNTQTLDQVERVVGFQVTESPTPGRAFPHTPDHGHVVPPSRVRLLDR
ncbi:MAG TPA: polysaccharide ABC transporter ATP-binding protein [Thermoanaerobaculia bacterium]|nr:polysaccharide ABC transporter ATP-binding protein [Thermoanaerobaculia bacterium]